MFVANSSSRLDNDDGIIRTWKYSLNVSRFTVISMSGALLMTKEEEKEQCSQDGGRLADFSS